MKPSLAQLRAPIERRLVNRFELAISTMGPAARRRAELWYQIEGQWIGALATDLGVPFGSACAAVAVLSADTAWHPLRVRIPAFFRAALAGDPCPGGVPCYPRNRERAADILRNRLPATSATGPKVGPFALALAGDPDAVVIDRHQARICGLDPSRIRPRARAAAIDAHRRVGARLGIEPRALQALLWCSEVGHGGAYGRP
jgi:hypothetical protein